MDVRDTIGLSTITQQSRQWFTQEIANRNMQDSKQEKIMWNWLFTLIVLWYLPEKKFIPIFSNSWYKDSSDA